jgi:hypothetical protein
MPCLLKQSREDIFFFFNQQDFQFSPSYINLSKSSSESERHCLITTFLSSQSGTVQMTLEHTMSSEKQDHLTSFSTASTSVPSSAATLISAMTISMKTRPSRVHLNNALRRDHKRISHQSHLMFSNLMLISQSPIPPDHSSTTPPSTSLQQLE